MLKVNEGKEGDDVPESLSHNSSSQPVMIGSSSALTKPGQRFPTPSPGNGDRVFYESLLVQRPDSEMAQEVRFIFECSLQELI
jgi:hypothetical protein